MCKLEPIWSMFATNCKKYYKLTQTVSIDESMCGFQGRHESKQYMPKKPIKFGFKVFALCDALTGYFFSSFLYLGKKYQPNLDISNMVFDLCDL